MEKNNTYTWVEILDKLIKNEFNHGDMVRSYEGLDFCTGKKAYFYYLYSELDDAFHRCDEDGLLGAKGQPRFLTFRNAKKKYEILKKQELEKIGLKFYWDDRYELSEKNYQENGKKVSQALDTIATKVDEIIDYIKDKEQ